MGLKVTAEQAGHLVNRHERIVRGHIKDGTLPAVKRGNSWAIDVEDLERIPGWRVDRARLATLQERDARTAESMAARIATLERDITALRARLATLEAQNGRQARHDAILGEQGAIPMPIATYTPPAPPAPPSLRMRHTSLGDAGTFDNRAVAARWLTRHGNFNEASPKSWPGWREVELTPRGVLQLAIGLCDVTNHRITWRLHECDDSACVCHELLAGA